MVLIFAPRSILALGSATTGMVVSNREMGPEAFDVLSRPGTARNGPSIDVLNQEVEEMAIGPIDYMCPHKSLALCDAIGVSCESYR